MREYGKVYSSFWQSPEVRAMSHDARMLALYMLTTPHGSMLGAFRMPDAYAAEDLQWGSETVSKGFDELIAKGFLVRDADTKWVVVLKFLKWNQFDNPNVAKAAHKAFDALPEGLTKQRVAEALLAYGVHMSEPFRKACETLCEPIRNKGARARARARARPSQSQSQSQAAILSPGASPPADEKPSVETFKAYRLAYVARYGCEPVRNAKVNGQLAQLVGRLGSEAAPAVARFYVGHQRSDYVKAMHPVDLLLRDAEGLHTAWTTGKQVTTAQAVMADRTQANYSAFAGMLAEAKGAANA